MLRSIGFSVKFRILLCVQIILITSFVTSLCIDVLKMKITEQEIADYMIEREFSDLQMQSVADVFAEFAEISPIICTV